VPRMKTESASRMMKMSRDSKILYKMTLNNIHANLNIFYDIVNELLITLEEADKGMSGEKNVFYKKLICLHKKIEEKLNKQKTDA